MTTRAMVRLTMTGTWTDGIDAVPRDPRSFARIVARQLRWKLTGGR